MSDQHGAIEMYVSDNLTFASVTPRWVVLHKTAGFTRAEDCAAYFQSGSGGRGVSSHYVVGLDGTIVQCVPESRGAGGNCCTESGHAAFLPDADGTNVNLNNFTISIEHIDPQADNSTDVPPAQAQASFTLIRDICLRHNIPMRPGDAQGGIIGHYQIAPTSRARCPGNYPWSNMFNAIERGNMGVPADWIDDGTTLKAPNGVPVVKGFRQFIIDNGWDANDYPLMPEQGVNELEDDNPSLGGGTQQLFRMSMLGWTPQRGVFREWIGGELLKVRQERDAAQALVNELKNSGSASVKKAVDAAIELLQPLG